MKPTEGTNGVMIRTGEELASTLRERGNALYKSGQLIKGIKNISRLQMEMKQLINIF